MRSLVDGWLVGCALAASVYGATFGTVVAPAGGAAYSDIVLDQSRNRLYLVGSTVNQVSVYSLTQRAFLTPIATDLQPVSAAISPDNRFLYVTAYASAVLDVIDLTTGIVTRRISLPSHPEGVAVGGDGRVVITAVPVTAGSTVNTLLIYDPATSGGASVVAVPIPPAASTPPTLPPPSNRIFNSYNSRLIASADGRLIIGANGTSNTGKVVFVYEVASGTVLQSRAITNLSNTLSISPDSSKFMAGSILFDTQTLQVIAQENAANAPFSFAFTGATNFNTQANQGGSIFAPDGSVLYAAFNVAPTGAARANVSQLLFNDPDNLLITLGLQMPENLTGKMVIDSAGANIYALSDSGFMLLPIGTIANSALAQPATRTVLLVSDACGVYAAQSSATVPINNLGRARFTATVAAATVTTTIAVPGVGPGGPGGGTVTVTTTQTNLPSASAQNSATASTLTFRFNAAAAVNPGTTGPAEFIVQSPEAINIPGNIHVYQNNRTPESSGTIVPISLNASAGEGLTDILLDNIRRRLYITNSGMNRIEVFDIAQNRLVTPIKAGQLPHGMALSSDGNTLYVANTGGESISIINLDKGIQTGTVLFPALPLNAAVALVTPQAIAASGRGPQFVMSDGTVWKVDGNQALPRSLNPAIFGTGARAVAGGNPAFWSMAATPEGEYVLLLSGNGTAYLYDYVVDDFTLARQVLSAPLTEYVGPVTAGPKGAYFGVGGVILNASLTPVAGGTNSLSASGRQTGAVAAISATQLAQFTVPVRGSVTAAVADAGQIEIYNPSTGASQGATPTLEGPASAVIGTARTPTFARALAVDAARGNAYALTATGLSIVSLGSTTTTNRPTINTGGVVSLADYTPSVAAGGLISIFGRNFSGTTAFTGAPLSTLMAGTCVTLNNQAIPLALVSPGQINAQIPVGLAAGRYPLVVRSIDNKTTSTATNLTVAKYAPAVMIADSGRPAIIHLDGTFVSRDNPANRDETLLLFATGLGPTTGGRVSTGQGAPSDPLAETGDVQLFFGDPSWKQAAIIVDWSGLVPGLVGVYQLNVRVPGFHISGESLPVMLKVGGVSSSTTGPVAPRIAVE